MGDSGGGMVFPERQRDGSEIWKLRGIVSNSRPDDNNNLCCNIHNYIIFTDIVQYLDWIDINLVWCQYLTQMSLLGKDVLLGRNKYRQDAMESIVYTLYN